MFYIADLHLHSHYSRATSKDLNLETLYQWARIKGIHVVGTGDFTHPLWFKELKEKLEPDGTGLFRLKNPPKEDVPGFKCADIDVRFCLTSEISSIYKHGDKVRKNHNCVYAPDLETVARINAKLAQIGNLAADGRPILGLPSRDLLEIVLQTSEHAHLIPAHIWTPWFSMFGSKSGYDSVKECFRDLSDHIFALETGLSSDPEMNWRLSMLDKYTLVSNSDAHSPQKLGREANLFDTERSYYGLFDALKSKKGFLGTYEFFPEEGKYHMDGHRKCDVCFEPEESIKHKNICPKCGQPLTIGVLHRVTELSDRKQPQKPEGAADFHYIIPLPEILSEIKNASASSKTVNQSFQQTISLFGNEFTLLKQAPIEDIEKKAGMVVAEAIKRMRTQQVNPQGGYDGEYGVIKIFKEGELAQLTGQTNFFGMDAVNKTTKRKSKDREIEKKVLPVDTAQENKSAALNAEQQAACEAEGAVLVTAGPGTGKTKTLISWIAHCIHKRNAQPREVLAVTFTNKAADEMKERLAVVLEDKSRGITLDTFHSICFAVLQERYENLDKVYDDKSREIILGTLFPDKEEKEIKKLSAELSNYFESNREEISAEIKSIAATYRDFTLQNGGIDLADIIGSVIRLWNTEPEWLEGYRNRYHYIAVDELQDINPLQYEFLKLLASGKNVFAIGDPDQSIYGFRGSDVQLFFQFSEDFHAKEIALQKNYRSSAFIVEAASAVIGHNTGRKPVNLGAVRGKN
ncbi:MAG: UvrD-helicase domain-containing protein [Cyclobacteriaceae bacterium]|nr:UvrD-helicase domain-containing protein [Cyclobacteriaceae bacterium]